MENNFDMLNAVEDKLANCKSLALMRSMFWCKWKSFVPTPGYLWDPDLKVYVESDEARDKRLDKLIQYYKDCGTLKPVADIARCALCGLPMPVGEEMFQFHGYSGNCPKGDK